MGKEKTTTNFNGVNVIIEGYTPSIVQDDVNNLVNFIVELFYATNTDEVQNG